MINRFYILFVILILLTAASCSKKDRAFDVHMQKINENESNILSTNLEFNDHEKAGGINISEAEVDIIKISHGVSSNLAHIDNNADIKKIVELFNNERINISNLTFSPSSLEQFIVTFYCNDSSKSATTVFVYDNTHLRYRKGNSLLNYEIENATIYDDIRSYYEKYK